MRPAHAKAYSSHAGVSRLVLTHPSPGLNEEEAIEQAAMTFSGAIEVAKPGTMIEA